MKRRFADEKYRHFANITQLMIFSNNSEYDDSEILPLEGAFYSASSYGDLFFNKFNEEDENIFSQIAPLDESVENEILRDTNYLLIKGTPEYSTNKDALSPTNKILTSLLSPKRFIFILSYAVAYVEEEIEGGVKKNSETYNALPANFCNLQHRQKT